MLRITWGTDAGPYEFGGITGDASEVPEHAIADGRTAAVIAVEMRHLVVPIFVHPETAEALAAVGILEDDAFADTTELDGLDVDLYGSPA